MTTSWPEQNELIREIEKLKPFILNNSRILARYNRRDHYHRELRKRAAGEYFFETAMVVSWIGLALRPRRIMEIGTRNGGSLIDLLSVYPDYQGVSVVCFDIWREIGGPGAVRRNLRLMNIPDCLARFVSGDSLKTVPAYKLSHPNAAFDYILVDGCHEAPAARVDLANVVDLLAPGGVIVFDDIGPHGYRLLEVWRDFQAGHGAEFRWYENLWRRGVAWAIRTSGGPAGMPAPPAPASWRERRRDDWAAWPFLARRRAARIRQLGARLRRDPGILIRARRRR